MATILTKRSNTASSVPVAGDLTNSTGGAELAVNTADKRLFTKDSGGTVVELGTNPSSLTLASGTANAVPYLNGSKVLTSGSALTFDGTNLGVGTSSPAVKLHASSSGTTYIRVATTGTTGQEIAYQWTATNSDASSNQWKLGTNFAADNEFTLYDLTNSQVVDRYIRGASGYRAVSVNGSEGMRLTSTGLGIGTSSPGALLDVMSASNPTVKVRSNGGTVGNYAQLILQSYNNFSGSGQAYIRGVSSASGNSNTDLTFGVNASGFGAPYEAMRLDSSGNLGLGVTPSAWTSTNVLQVGSSSGGAWFGASSTTGGLYQGSNNYYNGAFRYVATNAATYYSQNDSGSGAHKWFTAPSGTAGNAISFTQAMTLDASGNLGIGTSSPTFLLDVTKGAQALGKFENTAGTNAYIYIKDTVRSYAMFSNNGAWGVYDNTAGAERARIDSSGNLLVGTTNSNPTGATGGAGFLVATDDRRLLRLTTSTASARDLVQFYNSNGQVGAISVSGTATTYATSSDYRLKDNIAPMTGALAKVAALKPCTYNWKADGSDGEGFIAHELAEVVPQCVTGEKDAVDAEGNPVYQGIDTSFLVATLTAAIQELKAEVDSLKSEINTLKGI